MRLGRLGITSLETIHHRAFAASFFSFLNKAPLTLRLPAHLALFTTSIVTACRALYPLLSRIPAGLQEFLAAANPRTPINCQMSTDWTNQHWWSNLCHKALLSGSVPPRKKCQFTCVSKYPVVSGLHSLSQLWASASMHLSFQNLSACSSASQLEHAQESAHSVGQQQMSWVIMQCAV